MKKAAGLCAALLPLAAHAGDNDLQLWRLGNPDPIITCVVCDGSDNTTVPGDPKAQYRFARMTAALGLAFVPGFGETAASTGQAGFEIGYSQSFRFLNNLNRDEWASDGSQPAAGSTENAKVPGALVLSTLTIRKGLGGSFDIGAFATYLAESSMLAVGVEVRASLLEGIDYAPDIAIRAYGSRVTGTRELDLTIAGVDAQISKSWGLGGMIKLQPYGQFGVVGVNANTGVINFSPTTFNQQNPTAQDGVFRDIHLQDNLYDRVGGGIRLVAGVVLIGLEVSYAFGTNGVASKPPVGGAEPGPSNQTTKQLGGDAHLGLQF